jgi:Nif-specific regulatory protein
MPIKIKDEILGVLSVDRIYSQEHGDVDDDLRVLSIVSTFIGQFIQLWKHYRKSESDRESLISQLKEKYSLPNIIGKSERFQSVLKSVMKVACTDTTVLLLGESGTGKELIARTLHYQSYREKGNFVAVNVAALPENLIEVELFGSEKGAYTGANIKREGRFANANGGTLFLDEIGELPLPLQAKLLRVLQERIFERIGSSKPIKVDVRVIAATNKNLQKEVAVGNFREDLFWRLNVVPIVLPPLRERKEDIPLLLNYYLDKFNQVYQKNIRFSSEACEALKAYHWPGNIRELANTVERLIIMAEENSIRESDISMEILYPAEVNPTEKSVFSKADTTLGSEIERLERERIVNALKQHNYIQHKAASAIGITPRQLGYKLKKYGIAIKGID